MVLDVPINKILTPEIETMLKQHHLKAVGAAIVVETTEIPVVENPAVHIVKDGDTLYKIAKKYGISLVKLIELNNIKTPNLIQIGQIIKLK